jgi:hypothetical protein
MSIIDWAAFTVPIDYSEELPMRHAMVERAKRVLDVLADRLPIGFQFSGGAWTTCVPQRPYTMAWVCPNLGIRLNADPKRREALVVFNGAACDQLRKIGVAAINEVLFQVQQTGTRLDLATDILSSVDIKDIEAGGWAKRILSTSYIKSYAGQTLYIGSRKSEALCRVYRYNPPHPRSALIRVEFELKKDRAKTVAELALHESVDLAARSVAARFAIAHPTIEQAFSGSTRPIKTVATERSQAKTEHWLLTQAVPAFIRLCEDGVIDDPRRWVDRYMLGNSQADHPLN